MSTFTDFIVIDSSLVGEDIEINQYGVYLQGTTQLIDDIKFVVHFLWISIAILISH